MMNTIKFESIPNEAALLEIAQLAAARHLHLITNGKRSVLCSVVPSGWQLMPVMIKKAA
jgi:hypothetical protein